MDRRYLRVLGLLLCLVLSGLIAGCGSGFFQKKKVFYSPVSKSRVDLSGRPSIEEKLRVPRVEKMLLAHYGHWQGVRYLRGGLSKRGIDCSGFVQLTYKKRFGVDVPRTVNQQVKVGRKVSPRNLRAGDLIFFKTGFFNRHVGIYLGDRRFLHASVSRGVTISNLSDRYWSSNYWQARRVW